jgi:hypothetical protein
VNRRGLRRHRPLKVSRQGAPCTPIQADETDRHAGGQVSRPVTWLAVPKLRIEDQPSEGGALDGRRRLRHPLTVRERQPRGQLMGRLRWGLAVERHHSRGHTGPAAQLSAPPVADGCYLNLIRTPADSLFEMMNGHCGGCLNVKDRSVGDFTRLSRAIKRNGSRRRRPQPPLRAIIGRSHRRKICVVRLSTGFSPFIHSFSTEPVPKRTYRGGVGKVECGFTPEWLDF